MGPDGSPSRGFEGRHGSQCGCLASKDSQVGLVVLSRVRYLMQRCSYHLGYAQQLAPREAAATHQVVPPSSGFPGFLYLEAGHWREEQSCHTLPVYYNNTGQPTVDTELQMGMQLVSQVLDRAICLPFSLASRQHLQSTLSWKTTFRLFLHCLAVMELRQL